MGDDNSKKTGNLLSQLAGITPSSVPPPPPSLLDQFFNRPVVEGLYYRGKVINLDGYKFIGCRFDNCTLCVDSGNFELLNCIVDSSTAIQYGKQAMKIIRLFHAHNEFMYSNYPVFAPTRNPDGTISISGVL